MRTPRDILLQHTRASRSQWRQLATNAAHESDPQGRNLAVIIAIISHGRKLANTADLTADALQNTVPKRLQATGCLTIRTIIVTDPEPKKNGTMCISTISCPDLPRELADEIYTWTIRVGVPTAGGRGSLLTWGTDDAVAAAAVTELTPAAGRPS